jgi:hypothetical protein
MAVTCELHVMYRASHSSPHPICTVCLQKGYKHKLSEMSFLGKLKILLGLYDAFDLRYYLITIELSDSIDLGLDIESYSLYWCLVSEYVIFNKYTFVQSFLFVYFFLPRMFWDFEATLNVELILNSLKTNFQIV